MVVFPQDSELSTAASTPAPMSQQSSTQENDQPQPA